jgi:lysyl-tRNA synthetase class I
MSSSTDSYTLPSSPADRKKIKDAIHEIAGALQQMEDKRSFINDIKKSLKEDFKLPPSVTAKMAKTLYKNNYQEVLGESSTFEVVYENIIGTSTDA